MEIQKRKIEIENEKSNTNSTVNDLLRFLENFVFEVK